MNNPKSSTRRKFIYKGGILSTAILYSNSLISKTIELLKPDFIPLNGKKIMFLIQNFLVYK